MLNVRAMFDELSKALSIPEIKLDNRGDAVLSLNNGVDVYFSYMESNDMLLVYASLGKAYHETVYEKLLLGNFFWTETGGATLFLTPTDKTVMMALQIGTQDLNLEDLTKIIEIFLENAEKWRSITQNMQNKLKSYTKTKKLKTSKIDEANPASIKI